MRFLLLSVFLFLSAQAFSADRYWVGGHPTNNNWNQIGFSTTNWSTTSGGAAGASVPTVSDNVIFDGAGASGNSNSTLSLSQSVLAVTFTSGYTATVFLNVATSLTITGAFTDNTAHSWSPNASALLIFSETQTITSGGKTYPGNIQFSGSNKTKTLSGDWVVTGSLQFNGINVILNATTSETLSCAGITTGGSISAGTAKIILTGGTWTGSVTAKNDIDIAGNVTLAADIRFDTKTLTYVSGTVSSGTCVLSLTGNATLNTAGMTFFGVTITSGSPTLNSLLTVTGTLTVNAVLSPSFLGTGGFTCANLTCLGSTAVTYTFNDAATYTITGALTCRAGSLAAHPTFTSDDATNKVTITLSQGATCNTNANFTRVNSSLGRTIRAFNGTITDCLNVVAFNDIGTSKN